jgi:hypothetical protein
LIREQKEKFDAIARKGIPKTLVDVSFFQLVIENQIYFNSDFSLFSVEPIEGYKRWSDLFETIFKGYALNDKREIDVVTAPTLNYDHLISMLLGKDTQSDEIAGFEQLVQENGSMYFDKKCEVPPIAFASLMRSGNTFYRRLIEEISGVATGSNLPL